MIARSRGPSGANDEYLFMLEEALGQLGEEGEEGGCGDEHVRDLSERVRLLKGIERGSGGRGGDGKDGVKVRAVGIEVGRVRSGEGGRADEEVEKTS